MKNEYEYIESSVGYIESVVVVLDTQIEHINKGEGENVENSLIYRDKDGRRHSINFEVCAENFAAEKNIPNKTCIGERDVTEGYFLLYTSGLKTKIVFKQKFVWNIVRRHLLSGEKYRRFLQLQKWINATKYTTYDLS